MDAGGAESFPGNDARKSRTLKRNQGKTAFSLEAMRPSDEVGWEPWMNP